MFQKLLTDERGATAIEYGLICALMISALIVGLQLLGGSVSTLYEFAAAVVDAIS